MKVAQSCLTLCNPWTIQSVEFSRPEYWSGQPFPSPGDLLNSRIKPMSPTLQTDYLPAEPWEKPTCLNEDPTQPNESILQRKRFCLSEVKVTQSCPTLWPHRLHSPWNSPGQNTGVGSLSLLQRIFPTQRLNPPALQAESLSAERSGKPDFV